MKKAGSCYGSSKPNSFIASPAVEDGVVVIGSEDHLYYLNASDGKLIWKRNIGSFGNSPAIADGRVFVGVK